MRRILLLLIVPFLFLSCERIYINGELDGMWKLHSVESVDTVAYPVGIYYSFQRHLVRLGEHYEQGFPDYYLAEFDKVSDTLTMFKFYKYPVDLGVSDSKELEKYYIFSDTVRFCVEALDSKLMILTNNALRYNFIKW